MKKTLLTVCTAVCTFAVGSLAFAGTAEACEGKHAKMFEKADANGDGFLTQAEVGDKRWARLAKADLNNDGYVSKDELKQAKAEGKMKRKAKEKSA